MPGENRVDGDADRYSVPVQPIIILERPAEMSQSLVQSCVAEEQKLLQDTDAKNQEIFYTKGTVIEACPDTPEGLAPIGLEDALAETWDLGCADPNFVSDEHAWILFYNQRTFDSLDIIRVRDDLWELSFPAFGVESIYRFKHGVQSDTRRLGDILCTFFEEGDWRGLANFRFDPYDMLEGELALETGRPHPKAEYLQRVEERRERAIRERARRRGQGRGRAPF